MTSYKNRPSLPQRAAISGFLAAFAVFGGLSGAAAAATPDQALKAALTAQMNRAGSGSGAYVYNVTVNRPLFAYNSTRKLVPASNEKLLTTSAALVEIGAEARIETAVYGAGTRDGTIWKGDLYIKGQGDPTFGSESFSQRFLDGGSSTTDRLADQVADAGIEEVTGKIYGDESYFDSRRGVAATGFGASIYLQPLSGLAYNEGYADLRFQRYQTNPPAFAAAKFAQALRGAGIDVTRNGRSGKLPVLSTKLTDTDSPTIARIARTTNKNSSNYFAEMLLKQLGAHGGRGGTTAGGATEVQGFLKGIGTGASVTDGSGLSRANRISPAALGKLLTYVAKQPEYRALFDSLPIAGRDGTLRKRMRGTAAQDRVHAKTGTLSGVSALSGYASSRSGDLLVFSVLNNGLNVFTAHAIQDAVAAKLAGY